MEIDASVRLRIPAERAYVVLIRAAVSAMCARLDFTIDRIEDIKLAVDESAALLLSDVPPDEHLDVRFVPDAPQGLRVVMHCPSVHGRTIPRDGFTWTVLTALVDEVVATVGADRSVTISLAAHRAEVERP
ncbi:MAG TPA: anti-sigma regulatory factor [Candidatus Nanopelagicales bacterium]